MNIFEGLRRTVLCAVSRSIDRVVSSQSFGSSSGPLSGDCLGPYPFRCDQFYLDGWTPAGLARLVAHR
jgi:hypothetical protein